MVIDIVNYTQEQLAALSAEKVLEIREAQLKKNKLYAELQKTLKTVKQELIDKGAYSSNIYAKIEARLTVEYEKQVEIVREALIFFLHYVADEPTVSYPDVPYEVDYSLSAQDRVRVVKAYYETTYTNEYERYRAFKQDKFVRAYVGEFYGPLHDYFYAE